MKTSRKIRYLWYFLFLFYPALSQEFWEEINIPNGVEIMCIETNNHGDIFLGVKNEGNPAGVYRSVDNGLNWELILNTENFAVLSLETDEKGKIYCGKNGFDRFWVSADNGETWDVIQLPPPSYGNIIKIFCVGQDTIYVSSWEPEGAFILRSFDAGITWESSFVTDHHNEYVSDIAISGTGDLFVSVSGFFTDQGGVYTSIDGGAAWDYVGLLNHQVMTVEINLNGDVFTGDWWTMLYEETPGIYALYFESRGFNLLLEAFHATDIIITEEDFIYATANEGVVRSFDNGQHWERIEDELPTVIKKLNLSYDGHLYAASYCQLVKSKEPVVGIEQQSYLSEKICIYPNPTDNFFNIKIPENIENSHKSEMSIYNILGKRVYQDALLATENGNIHRIMVRDLPTGIYLFEYCVNDKRYTSEFIKQ
ncbi:MAG: hypothetical protein CSA95_05795 [Bacteroidetes bacterium]|nr:MAG: hypothetical protein CSA95_05795 [Bacteroidota bacterium]